jgi:hypothetical protein
MKKFIGSAILALVFGFGLAHGAHALTLSPLTFEITAKPGETQDVVAKLYNENKTESLVIKPGVMSFKTKDETGQPDFFNDTTGLDLQNWISLPNAVTLAPDETRSVIVTVAVPKSADPGGHYAAIFWGTTAPSVQSSGTGIEGRIATLVLVNVEGNVKEDAKIIQFNPVKSVSTHLPVDFIVRFQNNGSVHVHPAGNVIIWNMFGRKSNTPLPFNIQPSTGNVLPKSIREFTLTWIKTTMDRSASEWSQEWNNFAFGRYTAELDATYGTSNTLAIARTSFWVIPWMVSLVALAALIALLFILRLLLVSYNKSIIRKYNQGNGRR